MDGKLNYPTFHLCKKLHEKTLIRRKMTFFWKSVENRGFLQNGKVGTKGKCSKMAHLFSKLRKAKKIGITSRIIS